MRALGQENRTLWLTGAAAALGVHAWAALALPERLAWGSTLGIVLSELAAVAACLWAMRGLERASRLLWSLLAVSLLMPTTTSVMDLRSGMLNLNTTIVGGWQILFSTFFFVPLLLAASLRLDRRSSRAETAVHGALSLLTGALFYVLVFSLVSTYGSDRPEDIRFLVHFFDALDVYVAAAFTIRALGAEQPQQRRFFRITSVFLWVSAALAAAHNAVLVRHDYVWLDVLISAPCFLLTAFVLGRRAEWGWGRPPSPRAARAVRSASPVFLCFGLVLLGLLVSQRHFAMGAWSVVLAMVSYAGVSIAAQSRGLEAEASLLEGQATLEQLVRIDGLTEVPNRRAFDERLLAECGKVTRSGQPLSLLMIDIDHFKQMNDHAGHVAGDICLKAIAQSIRQSLPRTGDFVARFGGEEFAVLLPGTDAGGGLQVAHNLQAAVDALKLAHPTSGSRRVTISIGGATSEADGPATPLMLVHAADGALYQAKLLGRNRTEWGPARRSELPEAAGARQSAEPA